MPAKTDRPAPLSMTIKTISWRVFLTIIILGALAGPGADLLQQLASK